MQILDLTCNVVFLYQHIAALSPPNIELQDPDKEIDVSDKVNRTTGFGQLSVGPFYQRFIGRLSMSTEKPVKYDNELSHMYKEFCKDFISLHRTFLVFIFFCSYIPCSKPLC